MGWTKGLASQNRGRASGSRTGPRPGNSSRSRLSRTLNQSSNFSFSTFTHISLTLRPPSPYDVVLRLDRTASASVSASRADTYRLVIDPNVVVRVWVRVRTTDRIAVIRAAVLGRERAQVTNHSSRVSPTPSQLEPSQSRPLRCPSPAADPTSSHLRWYFYQKTKNYRVIFGGVKAGLKTGARLGGWTAGFVGLQEGFEWSVRQCIPASWEELKTRWLSGMVAGVTVAGAGGWLCKCSPSQALPVAANSRRTVR